MKSAFNIGAFDKFATIKNEPLAIREYPMSNFPIATNGSEIVGSDVRNESNGF